MKVLKIDVKNTTMVEMANNTDYVDVWCMTPELASISTGSLLFEINNLEPRHQNLTYSHDQSKQHTTYLYFLERRQCIGPVLGVGPSSLAWNLSFVLMVAPTLDKGNLVVFKLATYTSNSNRQFAKVRLPWSVIYMVTRGGAMGQMMINPLRIMVQL